ncbi:MAG: HRDC domain-containing protein [Candidatus Saccharimonadales bacterium]
MRQRQALNVMFSGEPVFLTGAPGAGKTYVLNEFIRRMASRNKRVAVTASTGIAATHIGGTTIHSWSGLGIRDQLTDFDKTWLTANDRLRKRYLNTDILVIDEISMLHGKRLDMVNEACKILREDESPFGGLQVIMVGDLFQLPPVNRASELVDFAHTSAAWAELNPKICYLSEQHRQTKDQLLDILEAMRSGEIEDYHTQALTERLGQKPDEDLVVTRLYAHNIDVDSINQKHLSAISSSGKTFVMETKGGASKIEQLARSVLAPEKLTLKIGAEVMFVANNFALGFANGTRGQVIDFHENLPIVRLVNDRRIKVEPHSWTLNEDGKKRAEVLQLPLRLAWAITIHKSQGMTLDAAEMDLSKSFTPGMGYVALSRVRSLDGIFLTGINNVAMQLHPDIFEFDEQLRAASQILAEQTEDVAEEAEIPAEPEEHKPQINEELYEKLRRWRLDRAKKDQVPPYIIAHNKLLESLAANPPASATQLLAAPGFGQKKLETYGEDLLKILEPYAKEISSQPPAADEVYEPEPDPLDPIITHDEMLSALQEAAPQPYLAETLARYPRLGQAWNKQEDKKLLELFQAKVSLHEICKILGRSPDSLWARLSMLQ